MSDVSITGDGTLIASDFTDDQVVSFDSETGAITGSAPIDRGGRVTGGLGKTAFATITPIGSARVVVFGAMDLATGETDLITAPITTTSIAAVRGLGGESPDPNVTVIYEGEIQSIPDELRRRPV